MLFPLDNLITQNLKSETIPKGRNLEDYLQEETTIEIQRSAALLLADDVMMTKTDVTYPNT